MNGSRSSSHPTARRFLAGSLRVTSIALFGLLSTGFLLDCAAPFEDVALDTNELEVVPPNVDRLAPVVQRPQEPFVMANLLAFKEMATGEGFEGLTGEEAYLMYTDAISDAQDAIGSRLIWAGTVRSQIVGSSDPVFDVIGLLEYASPVAFIQFALSIEGDPETAGPRNAGLFGQWLAPSTTLEEPDAPVDAGPLHGGHFGGPRWLCREGRRGPARTSEWTTLTGLSLEQLCRLLDGPAREPVFIVDLLRFADETGDLYQPYQDALDTAHEANGGQLVWRGSLDGYVLGILEPSFDELVLTRYPSPGAYLRTLRHPEVRAASSARAQGLDLHWIYAADEAPDDVFGF